MSDWISIQDDLPPIGVKVLVRGTPIGIVTGFYWGAGHINEPSAPCKGWSIMNVTHWMELPQDIIEK